MAGPDTRCPQQRSAKFNRSRRANPWRLAGGSLDTMDQHAARFARLQQHGIMVAMSPHSPLEPCGATAWRSSWIWPTFPPPPAGRLHHHGQSRWLFATELEEHAECSRHRIQPCL
jgi:hypothetical protein